MKKIRYKEISRNKYEIIVPDHSEDPIGFIYRDDMKNSNPWFMKPYFVTLYRDDRAFKSGYEDFTKAGRSLVDIWEYTTFLTKDEDTKEFFMDDLFKNLRP